MMESNVPAFERKKEIRQKMLALRRALSAHEKDEKSRGLTEKILSLTAYQEAKRILAYLSMPGEADLDPLIRAALAAGKEVYVPVCLADKQMEAGRLRDMGHFVKGPYGLRDLPKGYETISPEEIDLVLAPGVAGAADGTRLGMGAGYYDRYLAQVPYEKRVLVLWDFQVVEELPAEPFDQFMAAIVTDKEIIITKRG